MRSRYKKKGKAAAVVVAAVDKNKDNWLVEHQSADRVPAVVAHQVVLGMTDKGRPVPGCLVQRKGKSKVGPVVRSNLDTALERMGQ